MGIDNSLQIKKIPSILSKLPVVSRYRGVTISQTIYLNEKTYRDFRAGNACHESIGVILHEQTHVKRARKIGLL